MTNPMYQDVCYVYNVSQRMFFFFPFSRELVNMALIVHRGFGRNSYKPPRKVLSFSKTLDQCDLSSGSLLWFHFHSVTTAVCSAGPASFSPLMTTVIIFIVFFPVSSVFADVY